MFDFLGGKANVSWRKYQKFHNHTTCTFTWPWLAMTFAAIATHSVPKKKKDIFCLLSERRKKEGEVEKERKRESAFFINSKGKRGYFRFLFLFFFFFSLFFFSFPGSDGYDYRLWLFSRFPPPEIGGLLIAKAEFFESYIRQSSN